MTRQLVETISYAGIFAALLAAAISVAPLKAEAQACVGPNCPFRQEHKQQQRMPAPVYIPAPPQQQQQQQAPAASVYIAAPPPQQQPPSMPVYVPQPQQGPPASAAQPPSAPFYLPPPPPPQALSSACGTPAGFCAAIQPLGTACQCSDDSGNIFSGIAQ
jgi:hypothetical protein